MIVKLLSSITIRLFLFIIAKLSNSSTVADYETACISLL